MASFAAVIEPPIAESDGRTLVDSMTDGVEEGASEDAFRLTRGTSVDRYVVLSELGVGGMGIVYAAYDPELDRKIALKLLHAEDRSRRARQRLQFEAKAIARLSHPNVITVHDVGTFRGRVFVAMEFVAGTTFRKWVQEARPAWTDVLDVLRRAGLGLAAAHDADLVHRDFKPDNVLVGGIDRSGAVGRVVVADFGLARRTGSRDEDALEGLDCRAPTAGDVIPTRTGARLGTPAYMAPEQHMGARTDARTDQFAFCVVAWEALYGERPFDLRSQGQRGNGKPEAWELQTAPREPPRTSSVPAAVRRVLERGLSFRPEDRYPTIGILLDELARARVRRRGAWAWVAGITGALVIATLAGFRAGTPSPCTSGDERWRGVWDDARREDLRAGFERSGSRVAAVAWIQVRHAIDEFVTRWSAQRREACEATHVHHEQSVALLDARMTCLRQQHERVASLLDEYARADASVVQRAAESVTRLPRLEDCADIERVHARFGPVEDAAVRERIEVLHKDLSRVEAKKKTGRYTEALELAERVEAEARKQRALGPVAAALLEQAQVLERQGEFSRSERRLLETIWAARAADDDEIEARAWVDLVWVSGVELEKPEQGHVWAEFADAALERRGPDDPLRARLIHNRAGLYYREKRYADAYDSYRRALREQEALPDRDDLDIATTHNHIANVLIQQGRYDAAIQSSERALELRLGVLGDRHPKVAAAYNNLAEAMERQGRLAEALAHAQRALAVLEDEDGPGGPEAETAYRLVDRVRARLEAMAVPGDPGAGERE